MKNQINYINTLLSAFEARTEQLHEEIEENEKAMKEKRDELNQIIESNERIDQVEESTLKMVA